MPKILVLVSLCLCKLTSSLSQIDTVKVKTQRPFLQQQLTIRSWHSLFLLQAPIICCQFGEMPSRTGSAGLNCRRYISPLISPLNQNNSWLYRAYLSFGVMSKVPAADTNDVAKSRSTHLLLRSPLNVDLKCRGKVFWV